MEGDAQQPLLIEEGLEMHELRLDVEERLRQKAAASVYDPYQARLLDYGLATASIRNRHHGQGMREATCNFLELDLHFGMGGAHKTQPGGDNQKQRIKDHRHGRYPPVL